MKTDPETAAVLNDFIFQYSTEPWYHKIFKRRKVIIDAILKAILKCRNYPLKVILKYRNHPSIIAIQNKCKDKVYQKQIEKENLKLDVNKPSQSSDIQIKFLIENTDIFSNFLCS